MSRLDRTGFDRTGKTGQDTGLDKIAQDWTGQARLDRMGQDTGQSHFVDPIDPVDPAGAANKHTD